MTSKEFREFKEAERVIQKAERQCRYERYVDRLLEDDFRAVRSFMPESEMCLVALGRGVPMVAGEADFWFEDCSE